AADTGVAEEVEESRIGLVRAALAQPVPDRRHIGKEAEVPERCARGRKARLAPGKRPALGGYRPVKIPAPAAVLIGCGHELAVGLLPSASRERGRPHRLRFGADEAIAAIAFKLAPAAAVNEAIIVPRLANERAQGKQVSHGRLRRG